MKPALLALLLLLAAGCSGVPARMTASPAVETPAVGDEREQAADETEMTTEAPAAALSEEAEEAEPGGAPSETLPRNDLDHAALLDQVLFASDASLAEDTLAEIRASGDTRFVAGLIDVLRYQRSLSPEIGATLQALTGQDLPPDWFAWVEWAGQHPEIESFEAYPGWKGRLFAELDPAFLRFVHEDLKVAPGSRVEEIVWGGVRVDGIPALDNPAMIEPEAADYLIPEERVFGVVINGEARAYPARFLDWHEMFNDIVGGEPVSLAY